MFIYICFVLFMYNIYINRNKIVYFWEYFQFYILHIYITTIMINHGDVWSFWTIIYIKNSYTLYIHFLNLMSFINIKSLNMAKQNRNNCFLLLFSSRTIIEKQKETFYPFVQRKRCLLEQFSIELVCMSVKWWRKCFNCSIF